jgi:hypothetical protein
LSQEAQIWDSTQINTMKNEQELKSLILKLKTEKVKIKERLSVIREELEELEFMYLQAYWPEGNPDEKIIEGAIVELVLLDFYSFKKAGKELGVSAIKASQIFWSYCDKRNLKAIQEASYKYISPKGLVTYVNKPDIKWFRKNADKFI